MHPIPSSSTLQDSLKAFRGLTCIGMFMAALFTTLSNWKYPDVRYSLSLISYLSLRVLWYFRDACGLSPREVSEMTCYEVLIRERGSKAHSIQLEGEGTVESGPLSLELHGELRLAGRMQWSVGDEFTREWGLPSPATEGSLSQGWSWALGRQHSTSDWMLSIGFDWGLESPG